MIKSMDNVVGMLPCTASIEPEVLHLVHPHKDAVLFFCCITPIHPDNPPTHPLMCSGLRMVVGLSICIR